MENNTSLMGVGQDTEMVAAPVSARGGELVISGEYTRMLDAIGKDMRTMKYRRPRWVIEHFILGKRELGTDLARYQQAGIEMKGLYESVMQERCQIMTHLADIEHHKDQYRWALRLRWIRPTWSRLRRLALEALIATKTGAVQSLLASLQEYLREIAIWQEFREKYRKAILERGGALDYDKGEYDNWKIRIENDPVTASHFRNEGIDLEKAGIDMSRVTFADAVVVESKRGKNATVP